MENKIEWHCFSDIDDNFVRNFKEELQKEGIDINEASNGIFLPQNK